MTEPWLDQVLKDSAYRSTFNSQEYIFPNINNNWDFFTHKQLQHLLYNVNVFSRTVQSGYQA